MELILKAPLEVAKVGCLFDLVRTSSGWDIKLENKTIESGPHRELAKLGRDHYKAILKDENALEVNLYSDIHRHSDNSKLDGMTKISEMVAATEYSGALTDHGNMYGVLEYYTSMKAAGKKPILGFEAYTTDLKGELTGCHLILLAKNNTGVKNLFKLTSESFDHFHSHPHVTLSMLEQYHEGIIATAACIGGVIQRYLLDENEYLAEETIKKYIKIFGKENFYLEVQRHGLTQELIVEGFFIEMAEKYGLKIIATTDSHYPTKEDAYAHEVMLCMQRKATMDAPHWKFEGEGYYLHTSKDMEERFGDHPEWLDNTLDLADRCDVELTLGEVYLPEYKIPAAYATPMDYFKALCEKGFKKRFHGTEHLKEPKYLERFQYEMDMIQKMGFESYFLIVQDYIDWARKHDIYVGPGRGSAAGSLLAYCIGITDLDPIKYDLLFERFLNPERVSWPDIDVDFEHTKRQQVLDYIAKKYGQENVCHIVTFGTLGAKTAIRDVTRALGFPVNTGVALSKMIPNGVHVTIKDAMEANPDLVSAYNSDRDTKTIIDVALRLEGCKRHSSQHACFESGTMITTSQGLKRIEDVVVSDMVLTHQGRYKPVVDIMRTKTDKVYTVLPFGGAPIRVTGNHPLLIRTQQTVRTKQNGRKTKIRTYDTSKWKAVEDLKYDDYIGIPVNQSSIVPQLNGVSLNSTSFWWIVGRYVGDGWTEIYHRKEISPNHTERRVIICCGKKDKSGIEDIGYHLKQVGLTFRIEEGRTVFKFFIEPHQELYNFLQLFGRYAYGKRIPNEVLDLPVDLAKAFLDGYITADGHYNAKTGHYSMKTVSKELALGLTLIVNKVFHCGVGWNVIPPHIDTIEGREVKAKEKYQLSFIPEHRPRQRQFYEDGVVWARIKSVTSENLSQPMYNLTVMDDSSYQANGIAAHNCGFCVAPSNVSDFFPTSMEKDDEGNKAVTSQVIMTEVEKMGILKMDLLGLKNMTVIHDVINNIKKTRNIEIDYHDIPLNDRATYQMLRDGLTGGVFQLESEGMTKVVQQMLEDVDTLPDDRLDECFERMIAAVALYRPGPMDYIPDYVDGVRDPKHVHYDCPEEEEILNSTYGVMVYQEQLMQIAQRLAGYSLGEADILRKACGKKKLDVMEKEHDRFIYGNKKDFDAGKAKHYVPGCVGNGIDERVAQEIWEKMVKFASYAFNRSHAACYAYIAVLTAYMACHWTAEFYAAMLNAFISNSDKMMAYLSQATKRGIRILPPDLNESDCVFVAVRKDALRFGFQGISGVNAMAPKIVAEREANGSFTTPQEFYERMGKSGNVPSKALVESLTGSGAFSFYSPNKKAIIRQMEKVANNFAYERTHYMEGQMSLFDNDPLIFPLPDGVETSQEESLDMEKKYTGFYISAHPVDILYPILKREKTFSFIEDLPSRNKMMSATVGLIAEEPVKKYTRAGEPMYRFILEDQYHSVRCTVFPKDVPANVGYLKEGAVVKVIGRYEASEDYGDQFIVQTMLSKDEILAQNKPTVVSVEIKNRAEQDMLLSYVAANPGDVSVIITAKGKKYDNNLKIRLGQKQLDFLQSSFSSVRST